MKSLRWQGSDARKGAGELICRWY